MTDVTVSIRLPEEVNSRLEGIALGTERSRNDLICEAVARYVETEAEIIEGIKQGVRELDEGKGIAHAEVMREARAIVEAAKAREASEA